MIAMLETMSILITGSGISSEEEENGGPNSIPKSL